MSVAAGPVYLDIQATQSIDQRHRGIPRYVIELALALEELAPEMVGAYLINPERALPEAAERLIATGRLAASDEVDWDAVGLLHIASPLEMTVRPHLQLPTAARRAGVPRAVTFYDLIPFLMPEHYLEDAGLRRRYTARLQLVRNAAVVCTLSEATRRDAVDRLGLDPRRVFTVGTGTSAHFVPPTSRPAAAAAAAAAVPGLRPPYVFYIGSYERRKNLEPLLEAWSRLPVGLRNRWQLALSCPLAPLEERHLRYRAGQMGITGAEVCLTGFVPDEALLLLHQGADLFVFPSLYEGYGLPVAEALAAGAPVLASDSSSLPEILPPEALFDATDVAAMARALERGLTDDALRGRLTAFAGRPPTVWSEVAAATVAAWERLLSGDLDGLAPPRSRVAGPRVAVVGVPGPWLADTAGALSDDGCEVTAFAGRPARRASAPAESAGPAESGGAAPGSGGLTPGRGVWVHPVAAMEVVEEHRGGFDSLVYHLADDADHVGVLAALRRRRDGIVVSESGSLARLYAAAGGAGALPEGLDGVIEAAYGGAVEPGLGQGSVLEPEEARRRGVVLARDAAGAARRFLVTTEAGATLARLDVRSGDRGKVAFAAEGAAAVVAAVRAGFWSGLGATVTPEPLQKPVRRPGRGRRAAVMFDLTALQSVDQRHRGIARYVDGLVTALEEHAPGAVDAYLLNPDLALPGNAADLVATGKVVLPDEIDWDGVGLLHVPSLFELGVPLERLIPSAARAAGVPWTVTFHDAIPLRWPDHYLEDPGRRRRYRARLGFLRNAAAVLTNSAGTAGEAVELLGVDESRVFVAGTGTAAAFTPPASRSVARAAAAALVPGLSRPFAFYVGNYEVRKNLDGLLDAWRRLPGPVRSRHQLVVAATGSPAQHHHFRHQAEQMGINADELLLVEYLTDEALVALYRATDLFVFPSLYEGYGLPVAEALACGAPVVASAGSSLDEIVAPAARFDPHDPAAMAAAIERGLTDETFRATLLAAAGRPPMTWDEVAANTVAVWDRVGSGAADRRRRRPPRGGRRARLALVGPLPSGMGPGPGPGAGLVAALEARAEVHVFAPAGCEGSEGTRTHPPGSLSAVEELTGRFDVVVHFLADDGRHTGALAALRRHPGVVVAWDVRLPNLYRAAAEAGDLPGGLQAALGHAYGGSVPPALGRHGVLDAGDARRRGIVMIRDVAAHATRLFVASPASAELARLDVAPGDRHKIAVLPADPAAAAGALAGSC